MFSYFHACPDAECHCYADLDGITFTNAVADADCACDAKSNTVCIAHTGYTDSDAHLPAGHRLLRLPRASRVPRGSGLVEGQRTAQRRGR